jgi:hypothetical protein
VSLIHIRSEADSDAITGWTIAMCGHADPDAWTHGDEEASCADCIRLFLLDRIREVEAILEKLVKNYSPVPGSDVLCAIERKVITDAEVYLGLLDLKKECVCGGNGIFVDREQRACNLCGKGGS